MHRVEALRQLLATHDLDAYLVPSEDAHSSEYVAACDERRAYISGFTGSAGSALITRDRGALLYTDGRYFVQAGAQLDPAYWQLQRMHVDPPLEEFLPQLYAERLQQRRPAAAAAAGGGAAEAASVRVGVDPSTISVTAFHKMSEALAPHGVALDASVEANLVDRAWADERPPQPASRVFAQPVELAGESAASKITRMAAEMASQGADWLVVCALDEVAWLLNLRGSDIDFNPVFLSYVLVKRTDTAPAAAERDEGDGALDPTPGSPAVTLYTDAERIEPDALRALVADDVRVRPYAAIASDVEEEIAGDGSERVWFDPAKTNYRIGRVLDAKVGRDDNAAANLIKKPSPITLAKARKNATELAGMRAAHVRDAVAVCSFLAHLEHAVVQQGATPTECEAAAMLEARRRALPRYVSPSFPTISSAGANAAIVHYRPEPATCRRVTADEIYLCDSGGQYTDGTTDITRTMHFGAPTLRERQCFTRVLRGYIAVETAVFPRGTTGYLIDVLARAPLWQAGLDFRHGTGHGVGAFLNVHEGPQVISFRRSAVETPLEPGMTVTDEPGYYDEHGAFGMRFENVLLVRQTPFDEQHGFGGTPFYGFENITWVPVDRKLIIEDWLSSAEREWVDRYHAGVRQKLQDALADDEVALAWLHRNTEPL